jgi:NADH dehydrogenase
VILGGGFAGIAVAQRLERQLRPGEADIVVISRENFTLFTPMLPEVTSGALESRDIVTPIRVQLRRTQFILGDIGHIDTADKRISYRHVLTGEDGSITYDQLVLALGSSTSTFGLPGIAERAFALKTLDDAGTLRNRLVWMLEVADTFAQSEKRKRFLTIAVVGGGFTGVETAGELVELFRSVLRYYPRISRKDVRIVLIEGGNALLPGLPPKMGSYSQRNLENRGVEVMLGDNVAGADEQGILLKSGRRIDTATIVWSAGVKPSTTIAEANLPKTHRGSVIVGEDMQVQGMPGVWAIGDCAAIPNGEGGTFPATAQHAIREGPQLADNVIAYLRGGKTNAFHYNSLGMMASLGARRAVAQLPGDRVLTGFLAWFLWRSYYLMRLPGLDRKLRVAFDWSLELLFPRDIAELRIYTAQAASSAAVDAGLVPRDEPSLRL